MKLKELFAKYSKLTEGDRISLGQSHFNKLANNMMAAGYKKPEIITFATYLVRLAAGADNFASDAEHQLYEDVTGIKMDKYEFFAMVKNADDPSFTKVMDEIVDGLSKEAKDEALHFVALFFSIDSHIDDDELELFVRLEA